MFRWVVVDSRPSIRGGVYTWTQAKVGLYGNLVTQIVYYSRMIKHCYSNAGWCHNALSLFFLL